jgi:hypothetical protein
LRGWEDGHEQIEKNTSVCIIKCQNIPEKFSDSSCLDAVEGETTSDPSSKPDWVRVVKRMYKKSNTALVD